MNIELSRRSERDLRRVGQGPERDRIVNGLRRLADSDASLDIKALQGLAPWMRLRVGDWRVLYRPIDRGLWIECIIH